MTLPTTTPKPQAVTVAGEEKSDLVFEKSSREISFGDTPPPPTAVSAKAEAPPPSPPHG